ncbi:MAG: exosortase-associated EpsI family protein [Pirellulales bacterium]|nr:exosortase-associated EpsI family protein [Pirellulales bacterium]
MSRLAFLTYAGCLVALAVGGTVVHGRLTNRWGDSSARLRAAAAALPAAPVAFGQWRMHSETDFPDVVRGMLNCAGSWSRTYVHGQTGQIVSAALLVGRPEDSLGHTIERCYPAQGYRQVGQPTRVHLGLSGDKQHEFLEDCFVSPHATARRLHVCYAYRQTDTWCVPAAPRVAFGGGPLLYRLQVAVSDAGLGSVGDGESACRAFLQDFLPALEPTVSCPPAGGGQ